jgi:hypothetical protein
MWRNVLRMREDDFNTLSETQRDLFTYVEKVEINEYELHTKMIPLSGFV